MIYRDFNEVLRKWREAGGGLNYFQPTSVDPEGWEMVSENPDRTTTEYALRAGGMVEGQIAAEMEDWQD